MRNLDSCRCWRCRLCSCKVRNKFLVDFWNCTILLCIPYTSHCLFDLITKCKYDSMLARLSEQARYFTLHIWRLDLFNEYWREVANIGCLLKKPTIFTEAQSTLRKYEGRTASHEQLFLHANWEQQTKESAAVDGTSCCVILECLVTSIACITWIVSLLTK